MSTLSARYVEVSITLPDGTIKMRAVVVEDSPSPNDAEYSAVREALDAHPDAVSAEEFMQRRLTDDQKALVLKAFAQETWEGWPMEASGAAVDSKLRRMAATPIDPRLPRRRKGTHG